MILFDENDTIHHINDIASFDLVEREGNDSVKVYWTNTSGVRYETSIKSPDIAVMTNEGMDICDIVMVIADNSQACMSYYTKMVTRNISDLITKYHNESTDLLENTSKDLIASIESINIENMASSVSTVVEGYATRLKETIDSSQSMHIDVVDKSMADVKDHITKAVSQFGTQLSSELDSRLVDTIFDTIRKNAYESIFTRFEMQATNTSKLIEDISSQFRKTVQDNVSTICDTTKRIEDLEKKLSNNISLANSQITKLENKIKKLDTVIADVSTNSSEVNKLINELKSCIEGE